MASPPPSNDDEERPRKKRKTADPKERSTQRLDLRRDLTDEDKPQLDRLLKTLHKKRKIVVIAGAGISVSAGIPDFRSSTGLFKTLRDERKRISSGKELFDASVYQNDSSTSSFHEMVRNLSQQTKNAQPTAFHHLLATLAHEGRLLRLYTQNVDGIDTSLPPLKTEVPLPKKNPWPKTVQLHGGLDYMVCSKCHALSDLDAEIFDGPVPPACPICQENDSVRQAAERRSHGIGRLRPRMVLYNEHNPDDEAIGSCVSADLRTRPDAVIVAGTTLKVPGVRRITREMCATVRDRKDGITVWINNDPEPIGKDLSSIWDIVVQGPCDEVARHAAMRKWDDPVHFKEVTEGDMPKNKPAVVIETPKKVREIQSMPTPAQSPRIGPRAMAKQAPGSEPTTPSKRGSKRKSESTKLNAFDKLNQKPATKSTARKTQTQTKKATGVRGRAKKDAKQSVAVITDNFKQKKTAGSRVLASKPTGKPLSALEGENIDKSRIGFKDVPSTPRKKEAKLTAFKQISTSDPRYNHSPRSPPVEAFTPVKRHPSPSEQLIQENNYFGNLNSTSDSRPSTADSQSRMSITSLLNPEVAS